MTALLPASYVALAAVVTRAVAAVPAGAVATQGHALGVGDLAGAEVPVLS